MNKQELSTNSINLHLSSVLCEGTFLLDVEQRASFIKDTMHYHSTLTCEHILQEVLPSSSIICYTLLTQAALQPTSSLLWTCPHGAEHGVWMWLCEACYGKSVIGWGQIGPAPRPASGPLSPDHSGGYRSAAASQRLRRKNTLADRASLDSGHSSLASQLMFTLFLLPSLSIFPSLLHAIYCFIRFSATISRTLSVKWTVYYYAREAMQRIDNTHTHTRVGIKEG